MLWITRLLTVPEQGLGISPMGGGGRPGGTHKPQEMSTRGAEMGRPDILPTGLGQESPVWSLSALSLDDVPTVLPGALGDCLWDGEESLGPFPKTVTWGDCKDAETPTGGRGVRERHTPVLTNRLLSGSARPPASSGLLGAG